MAKIIRAPGIKRFVESMNISIFKNMDISTIKPMDNFMFHPLFDEQWLRRIERVIDEKNKQDKTITEIAGAIDGLSHHKAQYLFLLLDAKSAHAKKARRMRLARFFHDILLEKAKADHCGFKSNIGHSFFEIEEILKKPFRKADPKTAKMLGRLYTTAYHFVNGLYTDFYTDYGVENFGPYNLGKGKILVIKHFQDLRPEAIWNTGSPAKTMTIYSIYQGVRFKTDAISCHTMYEGDPIAGLRSWLLEIDREPADEEQIRGLQRTLEKNAQEQWKKLLCLDHESLKQKGLLMRCYTYRRLFGMLGMDWRPTAAMKKAVRKKPFIENKWIPTGKDYWKKVLDPEIDFFPW